jgi:tetratricopeptide (TPR) repeat protein
MGAYDKSIVDYNNAIHRNRNFLAAYANRGHAFEKLGDMNSAILDYKRAVDLTPKRKIDRLALRNVQRRLERLSDIPEKITIRGGPINPPSEQALPPDGRKGKINTSLAVIIGVVGILLFMTVKNNLNIKGFLSKSVLATLTSIAASAVLYVIGIENQINLISVPLIWGAMLVLSLEL